MMYICTQFSWHGNRLICIWFVSHSYSIRIWSWSDLFQPCSCTAEDLHVQHTRVFELNFIPVGHAFTAIGTTMVITWMEGMSETASQDLGGLCLVIRCIATLKDQAPVHDDHQIQAMLRSKHSSREKDAHRMNTADRDTVSGQGQSTEDGMKNASFGQVKKIRWNKACDFGKNWV